MDGSGAEEGELFRTDYMVTAARLTFNDNSLLEDVDGSATESHVKVLANNFKTKGQSLAMQQITMCELTAADGTTSRVLADGPQRYAVYYREAVQFLSREAAARKKAAAEVVERVPRIPVNFLRGRTASRLKLSRSSALGWRRTQCKTCHCPLLLCTTSRRG